MTPEELKISIFYYAMQGKLVKQDDRDGTADDFYYEIIKLAKKDKNVTPIKEEEIPFDIPSSWRWCKFGEILDSSMGKTPPRAEVEWWGNDFPWVSIADMTDYGHVSETKEKVSKKALEEKFCDISKAGTLLMSFKLTVGRTSILDIDAVHNEAIISIFPYVDKDDYFRDYLFYILPIITQWGDSKNAIKGKTLNSKSIANLMIPLAPLDEMHRIVAKIEELLPYVNQYAEAYKKIEQFNAKFPEDMKKSILQYAIQGKLVEQRPEEGTAEDLYQQIQEEKQRLIKDGMIKKDKPLEEIKEDEIPFDIPESWKWIRFGEIYNLTNGLASRGQAGNSPCPVLRLADLSNDLVNTENVRELGITEKEKVTHLVQKNDLIIIRVNGTRERVGRAFLYRDETPMSYCDHLFCGHALVSQIHVEYIQLIFNSYFNRQQLKSEIKTTAGQNTISQESLKNVILPLPPIMEQARIVEQINKMLPYCEMLIK